MFTENYRMFLKRIKSLSIVCVSVLLISSCSYSDDDISNDNNDNQGEELSNAPLSGEVYGESFSAEGGTADFITLNGQDVISVSLYSQDVACDNSESSWIRLDIPREVGMHEANVTGLIKDPNSNDFQSLTNIKVELVSFDDNTVEAKALINRPSINSFVNGAFEIQVCFSGG